MGDLGDVDATTSLTHPEPVEHPLETNGTPAVSQAVNGIPSKFQMLDQWHSQPRKMRIIHVGAGATGLCAAYKMERQLENFELVCYEKNDEIGGTWYENRYPGCACDVPAHIYTYTFEPNPNWKSYYAYGPEIQEYFVGFANKYGLRKYVKLNHRVLGAVWHENKAQWAVEIEHDGKKFTDWCNILVNGSGLINSWKLPKIQGLDTFKGPIMHTAHWDDRVDLAGKKVGILGNGSSAIQVLPQVRKVASKVYSFMRGSTWISPPMARIEVEMPEAAQKKDGAQMEEVSNPYIGQKAYNESEMARLASDPAYLLKYRKEIEFAINRGFAIFYKDTEASRMAERYMRDNMGKRLNGDAFLTEKLIPSFPVGCRRLTPGDDYLEALLEPNVHPTFSDITSVSETGVTTQDGASYEVDALVCATGFNMAWTPHFRLIGRGGVDIKDAWSPLPNCYLGIAAPGFPNYWVMNGPRGNLGNGTVLPCLETEIEFVIAAVKKMQADRIQAMVCREEIATKLNEYVDAWCETSVFSGSCRSWYKNNTVDGKPMVWGGSSVHFLKTLKTPRWEHFEHTYMEENPWSFLGNGRIKAEVTGDFGGLTPYLRNADTAWAIE